MDAHIKFAHNVTEEDAYLLDKLANKLKQDCDLSVTLEKQEVKKGDKDSGLTIGIAIAKLTFSGISALIAVVSFWQSKQKNYSVSVKDNDGKMWTFDKITFEDVPKIQEYFKQAPLKDSSQTLNIEISKNNN